MERRLGGHRLVVFFGQCFPERLCVYDMGATYPLYSIYLCAMQTTTHNRSLVFAFAVIFNYTTYTLLNHI
jgi:hypothetical protein